MTPERVRLVRENWARLQPVVPRVADTFYHRLFELDPGLRQLFGQVRHADQVEKLTASLSLIVALLESPEELVPELSRLGQRHQGYGATDRHYEIVGDALLATLRTSTGADWRPELQEAWLEAYTLIASIMKRAGQRVSGAARIVAG